MSKSIAREKALLCDHLSRRLGRPVVLGRVNKGRVLVRVLGGENFSLAVAYSIPVEELRRFGQMSEWGQIQQSHYMASRMGSFKDQTTLENMMRDR